MQVRKTTESDVASVVAIYDRARVFMAEHGNPTQWAGAYPGVEDVRGDIASGNGYVCVDDDGQVVGAFAFILGEEPTYRVIEQGDWHRDMPYGTIHRIASAGTARGVARACFEFCASRADYLRIDTHADNLPMQGAIEKFGFTRCGIIHVEDGSPRIAYDWVRPDSAIPGPVL